MKYGYIRTSTQKQLIDRQVMQLRGLCDEVFIEDGVSAVRFSRPVFERLIRKLRPGDTLVVTSLDRAFRSTLDALQQLGTLQDKEVRLCSLCQKFDTGTPDGKLFYTLLAAMAEWERDILRRRTREGLEAARRRGARLGRPRKLDSGQIVQIQRLMRLRPGMSPSAIAREYDISVQTLVRSLGRS